MVASAQGVDVSSYQKPLTPAMLRGLAFAFARVSNWAPVMGTDPDFAANWKAIKAAGLARGAYWYLLPGVNPIMQAQYFVTAVNAAGLEPGDMLVCDSEEHAVNADVATKTFCDETRKLVAGRCPVLVYTNHDVGQHLTSCTGYPLWFAYPSAAAPSAALIAPWKRWAFWQYEFGGGADGGDKDAFNGTEAELKQWVAGFLTPPKPRPPLPRPEGDSMLLVNGAGAVTPVLLPAGIKHLEFAADEGQQGLPPAKLRVGLEPPWSVQEITVSWKTSPVQVAVPSTAVKATVTRLDAGEVSVSYGWA